MRIAFIVGYFPALSETFILSQITGLVDRGHEVDIYAKAPRNELKLHPDVDKYKLLKSTYYQLRMPRNLILRLLQGLRLVFSNYSKDSACLLRSLNVFKYGKQALSLSLLYLVIPFLRKQPYDIVHCHFGPNGLKGMLLRDIGTLQGKLITTFHGYDVSSYPDQYGADIYKQLFQKGDLYTVNTSFTATKATALGCPKDKIVKLPVGLDPFKYPFQPRSIYLGEQIKIITVARLVEKKGIEYSIKALAKVVEKYPNLEYQIVGDGRLRESLEVLIRELNLLDKVKLLGWMTQDEVRQLYSNAHIFILSSVTASDGDQEGQGLVLQEAQAMGLPVLSTLHNGIPDGVLNGESGFLVPERDVDALAEKLGYLIEHPEIWPEMGRAGRAYIEEHYDVNKLNDQLVEIYQRLMV